MSPMPILNQIMLPGQFRALALIMLLAAVTEAAIGLLLSGDRTALRSMTAVLSILTALAALMIVMIGADLSFDRPMIEPEPTFEIEPRDAAEEFLAALLAGDEDLTQGFLPPETMMPETEVPTGEEALRLHKAQQEILGFRLRGASRVEGTEARQSIMLRSLDLEALQQAVDAESEAYLRALWELRPRSALAEANGSYLPEVAREAWQHAFDAALSHSGDFVTEWELELQLAYTGDRWQVENAKELFTAAFPDWDAWTERSLGQATGALVYARPVYTLPEDAERGPAYDAGRVLITDDPAEVQAIVDSAAILLDGQELCWSPEIERMPGTMMVCYCDETILVICWKEDVNNCCLSFCEVKVAHGSQLRRALTGGTYSYGPGPRIQQTELSRDVNAVVSIDGDFYDYRELGITVYQRQLYRNNPAAVDSCFFTASGDMLLSHRGELMGEGEAEAFIRDNDVVFGISFGPILVENGEATHTDAYPQGEVMGHYSRAAIGQLDTLHYLLMTCGFENWCDNVPDINQTALYIQSKGVRSAYTLDGGQTAQICVDGRTFNHIDFDTQRPLSDIIYFVTALPEE